MSTYIEIGAADANPRLVDLTNAEAVEDLFEDGPPPSAEVLLLGCGCCNGALMVEGTLAEIRQLGEQILAAVAGAEAADVRAEARRAGK